MINAHFKAGVPITTHFYVCSDVTMTTTQRLPSSLAKTIEILIRIIHFFPLTNERKTPMKCYPKIIREDHFQSSPIFWLHSVEP